MVVWMLGLGKNKQQKINGQRSTTEKNWLYYNVG
jgi:hypothetical protein